MAVLTTDAPGKLGCEASRRNKMFTVLHSYIPHLPPKIAKAELTEKNVNYIKFLEKECQALESRKHAAPNALTATKNFHLVPPCQLSAQNIAFQGKHFWPIN